METIYNELIRRDYAVDVGVVEMFATVDGKRCRKRVTFIGIMPFLLDPRLLETL